MIWYIYIIIYIVGIWWLLIYIPTIYIYRYIPTIYGYIIWYNTHYIYIYYLCSGYLMVTQMVIFHDGLFWGRNPSGWAFLGRSCRRFRPSWSVARRDWGKKGSVGGFHQQNWRCFVKFYHPKHVDVGYTTWQEWFLVEVLRSKCLDDLDVGYNLAMYVFFGHKNWDFSPVMIEVSSMDILGYNSVWYTLWLFNIAMENCHL